MLSDPVDPERTRPSALLAILEETWGPQLDRGGPYISVRKTHCKDVLAALRAHETQRKALEYLANEVSGAFGIAERDLRAALGNTNAEVLRLRLDEARAALTTKQNAE